LSQVEEISSDSKLDALLNHLQQYLDSNTNNNPYFCICSSFANTVQYISSSLRAQGIEAEIYTLTGSLSQSSRDDIIQRYRESGGVLIATDAALKGVALSSVNECLNYDLPSNFNVFERKWERFLLSERQTDFKMNILVDRSNILSWEEEVLKIADKYIEPQNDL